MSDDHDDRPAYDPDDPTPPSREPPLRSTAPQSDYTMQQVLTGAAIAAIGVAMTFGSALLVV